MFAHHHHGRYRRGGRGTGGDTRDWVVAAVIAIVVAGVIAYAVLVLTR